MIMSLSIMPMIASPHIMINRRRRRRRSSTRPDRILSMTSISTIVASVASITTIPSGTTIVTPMGVTITRLILCIMFFMCTICRGGIRICLTSIVIFTSNSITTRIIITSIAVSTRSSTVSRSLSVV